RQRTMCIRDRGEPGDHNRAVIEEFRARGGRVGGPFEGVPLLLLTTRGARTGTVRTVPTAHLPFPSGEVGPTGPGEGPVGDRVLVFGTNGGADRHPAWYHNILVHPEVTVELGSAVYPATAVPVPVANGERDRVLAGATASMPGLASYAAGTSRTIPVVLLRLAPAEG
ncbi:nitroreductase/quinone reductase family protein, partial [Streptomyces calidiresistens]